MQCSNNLRQIGIGLQNLEPKQKAFPAGTLCKLRFTGLAASYGGEREWPCLPHFRLRVRRGLGGCYLFIPFLSSRFIRQSVSSCAQLLAVSLSCVVFLAPRCAGKLLWAADVNTTSAVQSLDGEWSIALDRKDVGKRRDWFKPEVFAQNTSGVIEVPGSICQYDPKYNGVVWCSREFTPCLPEARGRNYLRFGAVSYACDVWLNGVLLGSHEGSQSPFEFDVSNALLAGRPNHLAVCMRGQFGVDLYANADITGINQHVTLATQPLVRIKDVFARSNAKTGDIDLEITMENNSGKPAAAELKAAYGQYKPCRPLGEVRDRTEIPCGESVKTLRIHIDRPHLWDLDDPFLYTIAVTSDWLTAERSMADCDAYSFRTGFREFRVDNGYFRLNGKRIFLKCTHSNWYDPVVIRGTARDMKFLKEDFPAMKKAGFNMCRFILSSALPEQLDQADELGLLIYCEHDTSWRQAENARFGVSLNEVVRRDRNHPSLVIWGLLNETPRGRFFDAAKAWLPSLRTMDDTRLVLLNSGRWDEDLKTGSASNPGSMTWDVYFGGEDPNQPVKTGMIPTEVGGYRCGAGDAHIYQAYPTTWEAVEAFTQLGWAGKPIFLSEAGLGSAYNVFRERRKLHQGNAPQNARAWTWTTPGVRGFEMAWSKYNLRALYPTIETMLIDSELNAARQRELMFSMIRSNPRINGYSLTSWVDGWGAAEGVVDAFRAFKPGHLQVLQAGWSKLRWCLLMHPMHVYADQPLHLKVAIASEDALPAGKYPATLQIRGDEGLVWEKGTTITIPDGPDPPLAHPVFEGDVTVSGLKDGTYVMSAKLDRCENAATDKLPFFVSDRSALPHTPGPVTVLGVSKPVRDFLAAQGVSLREFAPDRAVDREVVVIGEEVAGKMAGGCAACWRALYGRVARGAHAVFLSPDVFQSGGKSTKWLALSVKGDRVHDDDWLYHKDVIAMPSPIMAGLQAKIMTPDYYGNLLSKTKFFYAIAPPDQTAAVAIRDTIVFPTGFDFKDGVMVGTYRHHAGRFTIHGLNLISTLGQPASDRLLLNMIAQARSTAVAAQPLPPDYDAELDSLGIRE